MSAITRELDAYLVVKPKGWNGLSARLASRAPSLESDEVAIKLSVTVPDMLFKRPQLQATISIPQSAVAAPVVNAQVLDNVREVLEQQTGLDVVVHLVNPAEV